MIKRFLGWLLYLILNIPITVFCYITNPIVLLFCNEDGELPAILDLWQTHDNSCNPSDIKKICPKWLQFDWDKHYKEYRDTTQYLRSVNRDRWYTTCVDTNFTLVERIKRYICRCMWLTRNCSYGWGFYIFGRTVTPPVEKRIDKNGLYFHIATNDNLAWKYKNEKKIFTMFGYDISWNIFIGWKLDSDAIVDTRSMLAIRFLAFSIDKIEN